MMSLRQKYEQAKHKYHMLGKRLSGKPNDSRTREAYEQAKREYHRIGEELRREQQRRA